MKKIISILIGVFLLSAFIVFAHGEEDFAQAEEIIKQKISCSKLSEGQLELLGDYYMEQMHPGEAHEQMDEMMGGDGSESLRQMHINMAKSFYCGEHTAMQGNTMDMMMGGNMMNGGMMQGGMMDMMGGGMMNKGGMMNMMSGGMMGNLGYGFGYWNFINILYITLLIGLIILVYLWILKLWKSMQNKGGKK